MRLPLSFEVWVPGLHENIGVAAEPEGGQDGTATPAHSGVQLDTPDVGGEAGTAEQDRHLVIRVNSEHTNRM